MGERDWRGGAEKETQFKEERQRRDRGETEKQEGRQNRNEGGEERQEEMPK